MQWGPVAFPVSVMQTIKLLTLLVPRHHIFSHGDDYSDDDVVVTMMEIMMLMMMMMMVMMIKMMMCQLPIFR